MRGDIAGAAPTEGQAGIDHYIHTYYEDIERLYRENIFRLGV
jgi:integrase/recombinase XerD